MSDNEFLSPAPWRNRTTPERRKVAIGLTFAAFITVGTVLFWLVLWFLDAIDAPGAVMLITWAVPTAITTGWALRTNTAGLVSETASQSWTEYVIRTVMVGSEQARPRPKRLLTGIVFGGWIGYAAIVLVVLLLLGFG